MGKHRKNETDDKLQAKANSFDKQFAESQARGEKRGKIAGPLPSERRKQKGVTEEYPNAKGKWFRR